MKIRKAQKDDIGNIAELIYSSGPDLYDFIYKTNNRAAIEFIRYEFESGKGFCGYNNVTLAIQNEKIVATGCFFDGLIAGKLTAGTMVNMFKFYGILQIWEVLFRTKHITSVIKNPKKNELYLSNFGVLPEMRGQGIGKKILDTMIEEAKQLNYNFFSLDVADTNPRAEALYKKMGLDVVKFKTFSGKRKGFLVPNAKKKWN
jgi:ribosomal protein S18 acetylase RimI-like enzyme